MNPGLTWSSLVHWHTIVPVIIHSYSYYASRPKAGLGTRGFSLISRLCEISRLATAFYSQPQHSTTLGLGSAFLPCVEWSVYFNHVWQWFNQESSSQLGPIIESGMSLIGRLGFQPHDDVDADVAAAAALALTAARASEDMISEERMPVRLGAGAQRWESFLPASSRIALLFLTIQRKFTWMVSRC